MLKNQRGQIKKNELILSHNLLINLQKEQFYIKKKIKYTQKNRKTRLENFKKMYNKNYLLQLDFD